MELVQKEIQGLTQKLDALYQVIEQLDNKLEHVLSECATAKTQANDRAVETSSFGRYQLQGHINFNSELEHKDVLVDGIYPDTSFQGGDKQITPEIQIQRLTAQLTAAYNRIAALEEQLLLKRIH
ncbi:MAG: hypothetical protein KME64_39690 [Scytonematopsis contorta HA4267-MV1]|jgi:uncharacterized coiled-coil protein SlyX|nr:hypothetical protein [Scytonematopsis contorta HA4267-MV1]